MNCEFNHICKNIYKESIEKHCKELNPKIKECKLIRDIKEGNINNALLAISENSSNKKLFEIECPRSTNTPVVLNKPCSLTHCTYYSTKLSYNCILIHKEIFFQDHENIPEKLIEVSIDLSSTDFERVIELGIYQSRMIAILINKDERCSICGIPNDKRLNSLTCSCDNKDIRRKRLNFSIKWKEVLANNYNKLLKNVILDNINIKEIIDYDTGSLDFVRAWIAYPEVDSLHIFDLPFGFVLSTYLNLFEEKQWKAAENLGLTDKLFEKAKTLYLGD